jgi:hypothetical protein
MGDIGKKYLTTSLKSRSVVDNISGGRSYAWRVQRQRKRPTVFVLNPRRPCIWFSDRSWVSKTFGVGMVVEGKLIWSLGSAHAQHGSAAASNGSTTGALAHQLSIVNSDHGMLAAPDTAADAAQKCPTRNM